MCQYQDPFKGHTYYAYAAVGGLTNVDYATSTDIQMAYDALGRLTNPPFLS